MSTPDAPVLPAERWESGFQDFKPSYSESQAREEAERCLYCYDAPCIKACPTAINIPQFISRIATGNTSGAARTILDSNILGLSCARSCPVEVLCEGSCVYHDLNKKPIAIGKLQRFAVETAYEQKLAFYEPGASTGKKVALIGAGPASLACAHELRRQGHQTVIFEKQDLPGGLNTYGIAPYKMKAEASLLEIERIQKMGVEFRYGMELGRNLDLSALLKEYDSVFLGLGLGPDSKLAIPGADLPQVSGAVELIAELKTRKKSALAGLGALQTALVIGGGNTALDACRELRGLGVPRVVVSYRRSESEMSGYAHEFMAARSEGVEFLFGTVPTGITPSSSGCRVQLHKTRSRDGKLEVLDESVVLAADRVVVATGQSKLDELLAGVPELKFAGGRLQVAPETGATGHPRIFAGGDLANGGKEVVNAVAEGKRAAQAIGRALSDSRREGASHG